MTVIVMMILPVPSILIDLGLATSFAISILIFTVAVFSEEPLDFSSFPTVLLASLMLRLSLNISSTKLIIGEGHTGPSAAGSVIEGFAMFVMAGNLFIGIVIFSVLLIVNFFVINKGAARMAEVGARFALDGMPGKQLAIDSDVASGAINHQEAKIRREKEQAETTFFGSLDGASKFVKGDAIAGLLITLLNLIVGFIVGISIHGLSASEALETYSILTVGDGLVSQVPAVIIAIASALLLARGGGTGPVDEMVIKQLGRHSSALITVSVLLTIFAIFPGLPFIPFLLITLLFALFAYMKISHEPTPLEVEGDQAEREQSIEPSIGDILQIDQIHVEFSSNLVDLALNTESGLEVRIKSIRDHIARNFGLILPEIRITDRSELPQSTYKIHIHGNEYTSGHLEEHSILVLKSDSLDEMPEGIDVKEPVYGAPARWIAPKDRERVALLGLTTIDPSEVLSTHLLEVLKRNLPRLLSLASVQALLEALVSVSDQVKASENRKFIDDVIPERFSIYKLHKVLKLLLTEQVSIRNLALIMEAMAEVQPNQMLDEDVCEVVRRSLQHQLVSNLKREDGSIPLIQLSTAWDPIFEEHKYQQKGNLDEISLPPELFNKLTAKLSEEVEIASRNGVFAGIITTAVRRRFLSAIAISSGIPNPILSYDEIAVGMKPTIVGSITVD